MGIQPIRKVVTPEIPDKLYFRIGDVARLCEVPAYVLRFWETEFPQLKPNKGGTGQRLYRKRDVEMALRIKSLLYDQGYTIPGARQVFKNEIRVRETAAVETFTPAPSLPESLIAPFAAPVPEALTPFAATSALAPAPMAPETADAEDAAAMEIRRQVQLRALREELCSLLAILENPAPGQTAPVPAITVFRPRLVLEPRPTRVEAPRLETLRLVRDPSRDLNQGDLFPGE